MIRLRERANQTEERNTAVFPFDPGVCSLALYVTLFRSRFSQYFLVGHCHIKLTQEQTLLKGRLWHSDKINMIQSRL